MCISNKSAIFSNTKGYIGRTKNNTVVMAYQMEAQAIGEGLRAIILQIPAKKIVKIHDTSAYNNFLNEIAVQSKPWHFDNMQGLVNAELLRSMKKALKMPVTEKVGMYEVCVLNSYKDFNYLKDIFSEGKAPEVSQELIEFYSQYYSDWKFVVATFDNQTPMSSQPFLVEYESQIAIQDDLNCDGQMDEAFIFPALDNGNDEGFHEGTPKIDSYIREDHFLCFPHEKGLCVEFSQMVPRDLISSKVGFFSMNGKTINGDFIVFADGRVPEKKPAKFLGSLSINQLLHFPHKNAPTCAYTNW